MQHDIEHQMEKMSVKKSELSFARKCFLGILTGLWMALAGCFSLSVAGLSECTSHVACVPPTNFNPTGLPGAVHDAGGIGAEVVELAPILPRLVGCLVYSADTLPRLGLV